MPTQEYVIELVDGRVIVCYDNNEFERKSKCYSTKIKDKYLKVITDNGWTKVKL